MWWSKRWVVGVRGVAMAMFVGAGALGACTSNDRDRAGSGETGGGPDPHVTTCAGLCVHTPPATYTGPSLFWIGLPKLVPPCPPDTPYQGIEGFVESPMLMQLARECRITPTDSCATEGLTCSPLPPDDFHVCIHHDDDRPCPAEYPEHRTMIEDAGTTTVTLCCLPSQIPG